MTHPSERCDGAESFALRVIGRSMAPEFEEGEIVIVEPDGRVEDGSFVLARHDGEWILRQLRRRGAGWGLHALDSAWPDLALADLADVRGVVIQKVVPGRRRATRHYFTPGVRHVAAPSRCADVAQSGTVCADLCRTSMGHTAANLEVELEENLAFLGWLRDRIAQASVGSRRTLFVREFGHALRRRLATVEIIVEPGLGDEWLAGDRDWRGGRAALRRELARVLGGEGAVRDGEDVPLAFVQQAIGHVHAEHHALVHAIRRRFTPSVAASLGARVRTQLRHPLK